VEVFTLRATDLVRWHRAVNEIRYKHNELDLLKELADDYGPIFQQHVQRYCEENEIDIASLEKRRGLSVSVQKSKENHQEDKLLEDNGGALTLAGEHFVGEEPQVDPIESEKKEIDEIHDIFKRLFKKLAVHLHPDRVMGLTEGSQASLGRGTLLLSFGSLGSFQDQVAQELSSADPLDEEQDQATRSANQSTARNLQLCLR
jgi:hypothetical protein